MTLILLGSFPIQHILDRTCNDVDVLATLQDFQELMAPNKVSILDKDHAYCKTSYEIFDCEVIWPDSLSEELAQLILSDPETRTRNFLGFPDCRLPSLDVLYMLKMSHRFKKNSPHFLKTMRDIQKMREAGAKIPERYEDWYKRRVEATYWYEHPNLNRTKEEFFNPDDSFYVYDHDSIHEAVALGDQPAYTLYAVDGAEVLSSKQKFFKADEETRLWGVYEETCVLALERSQIPNNFNGPSPQWSFRKALEKVCTSITSGWFRDYAWEHYDEVVALYEKLGRSDYIKRFRANTDKLRPYERSE